jgi:hypothetical protein
MRGAPPPPDRSSVPGYGGEALKDVVYSRDGERRAVITEDQRLCIRLRFESWDLSDWKEAGAAYWSQSGQLAHIIDSVERARKMAAQEFEAYEQNEEGA